MLIVNLEDELSKQNKHDELTEYDGENRQKMPQQDVSTRGCRGEDTLERM